MNPSIESRLAGQTDIGFLDHLQTVFGKQLGYMPRVALEKHAERGHVWLALENQQPAGYILGPPRYHGRDDVAVIYQAAVPFDAQRRAVGTDLVTHWCACLPESVKQVSLWCAQDIEANLFWQSLSFEPLAYRVGSVKSQRIHIYWVLAEPGFAVYTPAGTHSGLMRENRDVVPLERGQLWNDPVRIDWGSYTPPEPRKRTEKGLTRVQRANRLLERFRGDPTKVRIFVGGRVIELPAKRTSTRT